MAKYIGIFATACLTRRQLQDLVSHLSQRGEVYCEKAFAGLIDGVLVCLFNAPNREALDAFCHRHGMVAEHIWRIDLESRDDELVSV
jgi:hypothetical protein